MNTVIEAMKQALEALKSVKELRPNDETNQAITTLQAAIEQMEKAEPVAWMERCGSLIRHRVTGIDKDVYTIPLYLHPAPTIPEG